MALLTLSGPASHRTSEAATGRGMLASMASDPSLPTGTVTFLFTDIEGSTRLLTALGNAYGSVLETHGNLLRAAIAGHSGVEVGTEGDSFFAAFRSARDAVDATVEAQRALAAHAWPGDQPVRVRMGLHTGEGRLGGDNYVGLDVHRAARIAAAGYGGQVLLSDTTRALVAYDLPDGIGLRDLAEHRLKDLPAPEHLWQLKIDGLDAEFPPVRSIDARPNNLPPQPTSLIGRERQLDEISRLLGDRRLLTLTGPGGTGKTRLALAVAQRLLPAYADGAFFATLEDAIDRPTVAAAIAAAMGVRGRPDRDLEPSLLDHLRDRELLLVLDNFEQVISAAPLVVELLASALRLRMIVTSRKILRLAGEQEFAVPPLSLPDPQHLRSGAALQQSEAVALFIERARAARHDFVVTDENARAVAEICTRLDGLPLAIELAAAAMRHLNPDAILARLERHLPLLGSGPQDMPARQRTLRAAVDWSYELLEATEQRLFARLAVFTGGWSLDAAEAVCDPGGELGVQTLDGLASLADQSLIYPVDADDGEPRFAMLQVIREVAAEKLDAEPDAEEIARRHARHMLGLAEAAEPQLVRTGVRARQHRLRREQENLRTALRWALERGDAEIGLGLAGALWRYWHYWSELREGRQWLESLLALPAAADVAFARAKGQEGLAGILYWMGEVGPAEELYEAALATYRALGEDQRMADTLKALTYTAAARADFVAVRERTTAAIDHYRKAGDDASAALTAADLRASAYFMAAGGTFEDALAATREAIQITRAHGRAYNEADLLGSLSGIHQMAGDYPSAIEAFVETTRLWYEIGNFAMLPWLKLLAAMELAEGRLERAVRLAAIAARAVEDLGGELPEALMRAGNPLEEARPLLTEDDYARLVAEARAMSFADAVGYVLEEPKPTEDVGRERDGARSPLRSDVAEEGDPPRG